LHSPISLHIVQLLAKYNQYAGGSMQQIDLSKSGLQRLHDAMAAHVDRGDPPGVVTALARHGTTMFDAIGRQSLEEASAMRPDSIFRIASLSKPIAAAATMMLIEDGRLALDEPVDRLLPELANRRVLKRLDGPVDDTVPAERPITVSDLLTLRMGIGAIMAPGHYPIVDAMIEQGVAVGPELPDATPDAWIAGLGRLPLMRQPGEAWMYDTGLTVLGVLIARASGQTLASFLRQRLLDPLGMLDTGFSVSARQLDRLTGSYRRDPATGRLVTFDPAGAPSRFSREPGFASASGGLVSTAHDVLAFAAMMLGYGEHQGKRLLSERSVALMETDHITPAQKAVSPFVPGFWDKTGWGYGLAVIHKYAPGDPRGCGWMGGYGTAAFWDRQTGLAHVLLTQRMMDSPSPPPIYVDFWRGVYEAIDG
jgi:CubicO group peptidase (beta-lactamase class C family)